MSHACYIGRRDASTHTPLRSLAFSRSSPRSLFRARAREGARIAVHTHNAWGGARPVSTPLLHSTLYSTTSTRRDASAHSRRTSLRNDGAAVVPHDN